MKLLRGGWIVSAILLAAVACVQAQVPGMAPWWDGPIAGDLGLSGDQNKQIRVIVRESRIHIIKLTEAVEDAEDELAELMNASAVDEPKTGKAIDKVVAARAALMTAVSQMSLKLRMVLTLQQWQELQRRQPRPGPGPPIRGPGPNPGPGGDRRGTPGPGNPPRPPQPEDIPVIDP